MALNLLLMAMPHQLHCLLSPLPAFLMQRQLLAPWQLLAWRLTLCQHPLPAQMLPRRVHGSLPLQLPLTCAAACRRWRPPLACKGRLQRPEPIARCPVAKQVVPRPMITLSRGGTDAGRPPRHPAARPHGATAHLAAVHAVHTAGPRYISADPRQTGMWLVLVPEAHIRWWAVRLLPRVAWGLGTSPTSHAAPHARCRSV